MKVLFVFAHPEPRSFNGELYRTCVEALEEAGHEVVTRDLYAMGFQPVPGWQDFGLAPQTDRFDYQGLQQRASAQGSFGADLRAEMTHLQQADLLIFQFPLWWFGLPAILKGWVDRVFAYGFAYGGGRWYSNGPFRGKRAMVITTTGGPSTGYGKRGIQGPIETILFPIQHGTFQFCGFEALAPLVGYGDSLATEAARADFLELARRRMRGAFEETPAPAVELADYGLAPKPSA